MTFNIKGFIRKDKAGIYLTMYYKDHGDRHCYYPLTYNKFHDIHYEFYLNGRYHNIILIRAFITIPQFYIL